MLTNDVMGLAAGQGCAAAFLDAHGKVQMLLSLLVLSDRLVLIVPTGQAAKLREALDRYLFSERVDMRDASDESAMFVLAGPDTLSSAERFGAGALPASAWGHADVTVDGVAARLVRGGGETGETEAWLIGPREHGATLWEAILAAGVKPVGLTALDVLRVEAGTPWFGHDVDETVLLPEIPAAHLVSATKGCYIGQEIVVRVRDRGHVNRLLTGLAFEGERVPRAGAPVIVDGGDIGRVTSAVRSFALGRPIAFAFVRREHATPGTGVTVRDGEHDLVARVAALPFVTRP